LQTITIIITIISDDVMANDEPMVAQLPENGAAGSVQQLPQFQIRRTRTSELYSTTMQKDVRPVYSKGRIVRPIVLAHENEEEEEPNDVEALPFGWTDLQQQQQHQ
jgi:hypothetical protein